MLMETIAIEEEVSIGDYLYYADCDMVCSVKVTNILNFPPHFKTLYFDVDFYVDRTHGIFRSMDSALNFKTTLKNAWDETHCPEEGGFIAYKKVAMVNKTVPLPQSRFCIAVLEIPEDARRLTAIDPCKTGPKDFVYKCRADKVKVLRIESISGKTINKKAFSCFYDNYCTYKAGEMIYADAFDHDNRNQCSNGIHFFMKREDAVNYMG